MCGYQCNVHDCYILGKLTTIFLLFPLLSSFLSSPPFSSPLSYLPVLYSFIPSPLLASPFSLITSLFLSSLSTSPIISPTTSSPLSCFLIYYFLLSSCLPPPPPLLIPPLLSSARLMMCGTAWVRCCRLRETLPLPPSVSSLPWSWRPAAPFCPSPSYPEHYETFTLTVIASLL